MKFNQGFDINYNLDEMVFIYGEDVFGPEVEKRRLQDIRQSLLDPQCDGPDVIYAIAMDIGEVKERTELIERNLLYGAVMYAKGKMGREPIRSQGHIHALSKSCHMSTPEVYEIWEGKAYIYMQESAKDNPGRCYAVFAEPGDVVIVPPGWAHATISADVNQALVFGAWCVRDYGFDYKDVREHKGLTYYPILEDSEDITWIKNKNYNEAELIVKKPREYTEFGIQKGVSIYEQFQQNKELFSFVPKPQSCQMIWESFIP